MADISVVGLGKVGLTLVSCLGAAGHRVTGVDVDGHLVDSLNDRTFRTVEPGVNDRYLPLSLEQFRATTVAADAVTASDLTFVIVPTPSNVMGGFSLRYVLRACDEIGAALRTKPSTHTVALISTVLPGSSDRLIVPRLEAASGRSIGQGLGYAYNPSFIALGDIVRGFVEPDYVLIGASDSASADVVEDVHRSIVRDGTPIARMSEVEAEITKIASNTHETMRVSFANMLFSICSEIPGANVDTITGALGHRMGRRFFRGALPYGGPCWPRDNRALAAFMDTFGAPSRLPKAVDLFNAEHGRYVLRKVLERAAPGTTVGILGLAYKPGTNVVEESFPLHLAQWLRQEGRRVIGWDPLAREEAARNSTALEFTDTAEECLRSSDVVLIGNPVPQLAATDWSAAATATVMDPWRCLTPQAIGAIPGYVPLGQGPAGSVADWLERSVGPQFDLLTN